MAAELDIVDVRCRALLEDGDEFVLRPVERAHASIGLRPDADILELAIDARPSRQQLEKVAPVDASKVDRAILAIGCHRPERFRQEGDELGLSHLARRHGEVAVLDRAKAETCPSMGTL